MHFFYILIMLIIMHGDNMNIKKILCKYFSEEDKKTVTIGSIIDTLCRFVFVLVVSSIMIVLAWVITAIVLYVGLFQQTGASDDIYDITKNVLLAWAAIIVLIAVSYGVKRLHEYTHTIKVTQCERKD